MDLFLVVVIYALCKYFSVMFNEYTKLWNIIACLLTVLVMFGYTFLGFRRVN